MAFRLSVAGAQPVSDALAEFSLRFAGNKQSDMPAWKRNLRVVLTAYLGAKRPRAVGWNNVIIEREYVQDRRRD
jgi:hypothetical protein